MKNFIPILVVCLACAGDGTGLDENGNPIAATSEITLTTEEFALPVGQSITLQATTLDEGGNVVMNNEVTWSTSNPAVATVEPNTGVVTAVAAGPVTITAGSDDATAQVPGVVVATAAFTADVQPIFDANCAFSGCHAGPMPQAGQNLSQGNAYTNIVNVPSVEVPTMDRVEPGDPLQSYLIHKIRGTFVSVGGTGDRMPLGAGDLPVGEIDIIRAWVQAGAPNN